jgi:hypothetical protein
MAELVQVPPFVLLRLIQRVQEMAEVRLRGLEGGEYVEAALAAVEWREDEGGDRGGKMDDLERHASVRERCQQVRNKLHHLLTIVRRHGLHGGRTPSVLCGGATSLILSCHPYSTFHCHTRPSDVMRVLSTALHHSPRSLSDCQRVIRVELCRLFPSSAAAVPPLTSSSLSLSLLLAQLDVLDQLASNDCTAPVPSSSSSHSVSLVWGEDEEGEDQGEVEVNWSGVGGGVDVDEYLRTEQEVEEWQTITSGGNKPRGKEGKERAQPIRSVRKRKRATPEPLHASLADGDT